MTVPRKLSVNPASPFYDKAAAATIDKVFVDAVHLPQCVAYDQDAGWAFAIVDGVWQPKVHGVVTAKLKP